MSSVKKLTISGIVIALYVALMFFTQGFAFGQFQVRIATALYALSAIHPFLIGPLALSNLLSNTLMGGLGPADMIGGAAVGLVTSTAVYLVRRYSLNDWFIAVPVILGPGLLVPVWLAWLIHVPYAVLAVSITIGQILPGIAGVLLVKQLRGRIN